MGSMDGVRHPIDGGYNVTRGTTRAERAQEREEEAFARSPIGAKIIELTRRLEAAERFIQGLTGRGGINVVGNEITLDPRAMRPAGGAEVDKLPRILITTIANGGLMPVNFYGEVSG